MESAAAAQTPSFDHPMTQDAPTPSYPEGEIGSTVRIEVRRLRSLVTSVEQCLTGRRFPVRGGLAAQVMRLNLPPGIGPLTRLCMAGVWARIGPRKPVCVSHGQAVCLS
jgi:hypothetical protein